ncbi:TPA: hypothetical protein ACGUPP_004458 [Vibrio vulnificus]|nr:hypothetical protein [Vibrio vulnificus]
MKDLYSKGFLKSLVSKRIVPLSEQVGEVAIDLLLTDELIKSIPILGPALRLIEAGNDIRAYAFAKKVSMFLFELDTLSIEQREKFVAQTESSVSKSQELGKAILFTLDALSSADAAKYLGRSFKLYIGGSLTKESFDIYSHLVSNLTPHVIQHLHYAYQNAWSSGFSGDSMYYLASLGLIDMNVVPKHDGNNIKFMQHPSCNEFGRLFYKRVILGESLPT